MDNYVDTVDKGHKNKLFQVLKNLKTVHRLQNKLVKYSYFKKTPKILPSKVKLLLSNNNMVIHETWRILFCMAGTTAKQKIGALGEEIAAKYLKNKGFSIIDRNYLKKCGEIDIVAQKGKILHFIEVKSVSCENLSLFEGNVSRETGEYRPEDNIHAAKLKRLARTIEVYLLEKFKDNEPEWQFDAVTVRLKLETKQAEIEFIENLIL